jgi:hypothetical protein
MKPRASVVRRDSTSNSHEVRTYGDLIDGHHQY